MKNNRMHPNKSFNGNTAWQDAARPRALPQADHGALLHEAREVLEDGMALARQGLGTAKTLAIKAAKIASTVAAEELDQLSHKVLQRAKTVEL